MCLHGEGFQIAAGSHWRQGSCSEIMGSVLRAPGKLDGLQLRMLGNHDRGLGSRAERWPGVVVSFGKGLEMKVGGLELAVEMPSWTREEWECLTSAAVVRKDRGVPFPEAR